MGESTEDVPDICIIGAGLAGGILAYELARNGVKVVVLEAGRRHDPKARFIYMEAYLEGSNPWISDNPDRDLYTNTGEINYQLNERRVKAVGGSTLHWSAHAERLHETDFKMKSLFGIAEDWPISYGEIEPYYAKAEVALGVAGVADNPFASHRSTDFPLPPFPFSYGDKIIKKACDRLGIIVHNAPCARNSITYQDRAACQAFGTCTVCPINAKYTADVDIRLAELTSNAKIISNAPVLRINTDSSGKVYSVTYVEADKKIEKEQKAKVFILAAHAVESARLLLLSKCSDFPDGLANNSGMVGRGFMEHPEVGVTGRINQRVFPNRIGFGTARSHQFCVSKRRDTMGAFNMLHQDGALVTNPASIALKSGNWGDQLKKEIIDSFDYQLALISEIEQLPNENNTISLDPQVMDCFGNPCPRINYSIGEHEKETAKRSFSVMGKVFDALGANQISRIPREGFGFGGHHIGVCRMGNDPERSVVDPNLRAHDVKNLFIVGSSVFVTGGASAPSLTIAALAIRAAEYIMQNPI